MKPLLFVLLAASLVANVVLGVLARRSSSPASGAPALVPVTGDSASALAPGQSPATVAIGSPGGSAAAPASVPTVWHAANTDQDLHRVVAGLRAAGYPATVIRAVINQLLNERYAARQPDAGQPFWKQGLSTPETAAAQTVLNNERQALFESLLGPDARPSAVLTPVVRDRRYGALSDDKIDAIAKIERDYNEMSAEAWAKRRGNAVTSMDAMMQSQQLMEKEKLADLASVLTPEELAQYEMRNSNVARTLFNNLRNVEITEAEYARLYQAQKAFTVANPPRSTMDGVTYAQRQLAQLALNEQARAVLGDARFYSYLEGADSSYANVAQALGKYPAVTPAATYQVYQLQTELQSQMTQLQSVRSGPPPPEKMEELRTTVASYNTRLEATLGTEVAEAYRNQGMGRIFTSFRQAPRSLVPGAK